MKTIEQHFADWEASAFGYGYGSGEEHVLAALKTFMAGMTEKPYDYRELEGRLTPVVAWLLINALCRANVIEYGSSPRFGWLTSGGQSLARFVSERDAEQLSQATAQDDNYVHCYPDYCNCGDGADCRKVNPFWAR